MKTTHETQALGQKLKNSVTLKMITITILILLLLIPMAMIKNIITERENYKEKAIAEVSNKWAGKQLLKGPILTIPITYERRVNKKIKTCTKYYHILPKTYNVKGSIVPKKLKRGIYEIVVYESELETFGDFSIPTLNNLTNVKEVLWNEAFITLGISDLKGIKNQLQLKWGNKQLEISPGSKILKMIPSGVTVKLNNLNESSGKIVPFNFHINLQGSQNIAFVPVGKITNVAINAPWKSPSFFGDYLPDSRQITDKGFSATWKVLQLNRNFPQTWYDNDYNELLDKAAFGVNLKLPLDDYQKSNRSAKYALLILGLTFLLFFLAEIMNHKKIHPLQYILVGLALCIFYVLLVSFSEHLNFNNAYLISSLVVISIIIMYVSSIFKQSKITFLIAVILVKLYVFVFIILQLVDYALLIGSIGLIIILGATMFFTRKIDWYRIQLHKE